MSSKPVKTRKKKLISKWGPSAKLYIYIYIYINLYEQGPESSETYCIVSPSSKSKHGHKHPKQAKSNVKASQASQASRASQARQDKQSRQGKQNIAKR